MGRISLESEKGLARFQQIGPDETFIYQPHGQQFLGYFKHWQEALFMIRIFLKGNRFEQCERG
jgi:hypothetical protein